MDVYNNNKVEVFNVERERDKMRISSSPFKFILDKKGIRKFANLKIM